MVPSDTKNIKSRDVNHDAIYSMKSVQDALRYVVVREGIRFPAAAQISAEEPEGLVGLEDVSGDQRAVIVILIFSAHIDP